MTDSPIENLPSFDITNATVGIVNTDVRLNATIRYENPGPIQFAPVRGTVKIFEDPDTDPVRVVELDLPDVQTNPIEITEDFPLVSGLIIPVFLTVTLVSIDTTLTRHRVTKKKLTTYQLS